MWWEHPLLGSAADVVLLPIQETDFRLWPHDLGDTLPTQPRGPGPWIDLGEDVAVIGYPFGLRSGGGQYPVWIRGTIATDPFNDYDNMPRFLIDSRTRKGQSGAPVIIRRGPGMVMTDQGITMMTVTPMIRLLGVYTGRVNEKADLGFVWRTEVVRAIRDAGERTAFTKTDDSRE